MLRQQYFQVALLIAVLKSLVQCKLIFYKTNDLTKLLHLTYTCLPSLDEINPSLNLVNKSQKLECFLFLWQFLL